MQIRLVGAALIHVDGQTNRNTDVRKLVKNFIRLCREELKDASDEI
jgi:hypothetical protein